MSSCFSTYVPFYKMKYLEEAAAAIDITLSDQEVAFLEAPYKPHPVMGIITPRDLKSNIKQR